MVFCLSTNILSIFTPFFYSKLLPFSRLDLSDRHEIKMWPAIQSFKDGLCHFGNQAERHPLEQAKHYASNIQLTHAFCTRDGGSVSSCSFVPLTSPKPKTGNRKLLNYPTKGAPNFLTTADLISFHLENAPNPPSENTIKTIKSRILHTSPSLAAFALLPFTGDTGIKLSLEQEKAASHIFKACNVKSSGKRVIIVHGGPGTGKSVIALKIFGEMLKTNIGAFRYLTNTTNFRDYIKGMLFEQIYSKSREKSTVNERVDYLIEKFSAISGGTKQSTYELLIADEAQALELRHKDGPQYKPSLTPPSIDIIQQARVSVFFLDAKQTKKKNMVGTPSHIKLAAQLLGIDVKEFELHRQFRCGQRDEVIQLIEEILGYSKRVTDGTRLDIGDYEISVFDCIHELEAHLGTLPENETKRLIAGFSWEWLDDKRNPDVHDISIDCMCGKHFSKSWNLEHGSDSIDPRKSNGYIHGTKKDFDIDILSIHTTGGMEFDHVGLVIGNDVVATGTETYTQLSFNPLQKTDSGITPDILRNNYRTISTRGRKSLFIYAVNKDVYENISSYISSRIKKFRTEIS